MMLTNEEKIIQALIKHKGGCVTKEELMRETGIDNYKVFNVTMSRVLSRNNIRIKRHHERSNGRLIVVYCVTDVE